MKAMARIRVLIADDDPALAGALADSIALANDLELVAVANDTESAVRAATQHRPDVVLMDVKMPGGGGVAATEGVLAAVSGVRVVGLSAHGDQATALQMLEAGAVAYIVKGMPEIEILDAIRRAGRGQLSMPADLGVAAFRDLLGQLRDQAKSEAERRSGEERVHTLIDSMPEAGHLRLQSQQMVRGILESAPDAMVVVDEQGRIQVVNSRTEQLFGYSRQELLERTVDELVPKSLREGHAAQRAKYFRDPQVRPMGQGLELFGLRRDGSEFPVAITLSSLRTDEGLLVIASVRDITDRRAAERRLAQTQESGERRRLMAHLVHALEEDRRRIAADIHDDSIQAMTATSLRMQQLRKHLVDPKEQELLGKLDEAVRESINRLRRLMFDLRPPALDRSGVAAALREFLDAMKTETGIDYTLDDRLVSEPSGNLRIELYRIAQETLINVRKHARASTVGVELWRVEQGCHVRITDNGIGFDVWMRSGQPGHLGLMAMHQRAQITGGWLTVESRRGAGTTVDFWLPDEGEGVGIRLR